MMRSFPSKNGGGGDEKQLSVSPAGRRGLKLLLLAVAIFIFLGILESGFIPSLTIYVPTTIGGVVDVIAEKAGVGRVYHGMDATLLENHRKLAVERMVYFEPERGVRFLYKTYGLLLAVLPREPTENVVRIVHLGGDEHDTLCETIRISIWVRIDGDTELVAGLTTQHATKCLWEFWHEPLKSGENYEVFTKVLVINDGMNYDVKQCNPLDGMVYNGTVIEEYMGLPPFMCPVDTCCDLCTMHANCFHYSHLGQGILPHCIFFSDVTGSYKTDGPKATSGTTRPKNVTENRFIGCGWCQQLEKGHVCNVSGTDDMPYRLAAEFEITNNGKSISRSDAATLPTCPKNLAGVGHGRWVKTDARTKCFWQNSTQDKLMSPTNAHLPSQPEECWLHDYLIGNRCHDGCDRAPLRSIWRSPIAPKGHLFQYRWKPYSCDLPLYTSKQIRKCFHKNGYARPIVPNTLGDSITKFFLNYIDMRFGELEQDMTPNITYGKRQVLLANFGLVHAEWHYSNEKWEKEVLRKATKITMYKNDSVALWLYGPFLSSERQVHVTFGRMKTFGDIARPILSEKGWIEVDWTNVSMALTYENAAQNDGLHVVGSSMKMLFHMVIHTLCHDDG